MRTFCHRCHGEINADPGDSTFCPHCGAPQLTVIEENVTAAALSPDTTSGAVPPPLPGRVLWGAVVRFAVIVAGVAAVLMAGVFVLPQAFPIAWLWTVCGAVVVLGLYQRAHPETAVNAGTGARVGLVYGLLAIAALAFVLAVAGLVARFGLHRMGNLDGWLALSIHTAMEQQIQQMQQSAQAGGTPFPADQMRGFFYSPEFRAGFALAMLGFSAMFLLAFSTLGGAVGGLLRMRRVNPS